MLPTSNPLSGLRHSFPHLLGEVADSSQVIVSSRIARRWLKKAAFLKVVLLSLVAGWQPLLMTSQWWAAGSGGKSPSSQLLSGQTVLQMSGLQVPKKLKMPGPVKPSPHQWHHRKLQAFQLLCLASPKQDTVPEDVGAWCGRHHQAWEGGRGPHWLHSIRWCWLELFTFTSSWKNRNCRQRYFMTCSWVPGTVLLQYLGIGRQNSTVLQVFFSLWLPYELPDTVPLLYMHYLI